MSASWTKALIGAALLLLPGALLLLPVLVWWRHRSRTTPALLVLAANPPGSARSPGDFGAAVGPGALPSIASAKHPSP